MTHRILTGLLFLLTLGFASCNSCAKEEKPTQKTEFEAHVSEADTTAVKQLVDNFFDRLIHKDYYGAAGMLYTRNKIEGTTPELLNNEQIEKKVESFKYFPYVGYEIEYMKFYEADNNEISCRVVLKRGENGEPDATVRFHFTPVYYSGEWRLILTDSRTGEKPVIDQTKVDSMRTEYDNSTAATKDKTLRNQVED